MSEQRTSTADGPNLSTRIEDTAAHAELGHHRKTYGPTRHDWLRIHRPGYAALVLTAVLAVGIVVGSLTISLLAGLFLIPCLVGWVIVVTRAKRLTKGIGRLDLYDAGLTATFDEQFRVVHYDTTTVLQDIVRHMHNGVHTHTTYTYTLTDVTGEKFVLREGFERPTEWGTAIQDALTDMHLPRAYDAIQAGQRFYFGDLWISATEVGSQQTSIPWQEIELITINRGTLTILVAGKRIGLTANSVRDIPNFLIFHALAEYLRGWYSRQE